ncbi:MAG: hypothetical protein ACFFF4_03545 [Candidatus Thorarchaeota archaeon]
MDELAVDIFTLVPSTMLFVASLGGTITSLQLYKRIGAKFFHLAMVFFFFVGLWSLTFIISSIFNAPVFFDIVLGSQYILLPFGFLALAFMVSAMEHVKSSSTFVNNSGFLFAGGVIAGLYSPTAYHLIWTDTGWSNEFSLTFQLGRAALFIIVVYSTLPLIVRIFRRLRISIRQDILTRILFWVIIIVFPFTLFIQPFGDVAPALMQPLYHPAVFLVMNTLFLLLIIRLFVRHPTILFSGTNEIEEIYIINRNSGLPLYHYNFLPNNGYNGSEILSAFFTGIRHYVKHSLGSGEIERILVGEHELVIQEGIFTYGILITNQSTDISVNLLRLSIDEFEMRYGLEIHDHVEPRKYLEFDDVIIRYFEFALSIQKQKT